MGCGRDAFGSEPLANNFRHLSDCPNRSLIHSLRTKSGLLTVFKPVIKTNNLKSYSKQNTEFFNVRYGDIYSNHWALVG
jgi:hypothetical protein